MAILIPSIEILKQHVSVNKNIAYSSIEPYLKQADRKYIQPVIGSVLYADFTDNPEPTNANLKKVYNLLQESSSNLAWFLYLPLANVQVSDNGIAVSSGDNYKSADWWQIKDLRRSFLDAGLSAIDEALLIMECNESDFPDWVASNGYTVFKELFVKRTDTFNKWFNIDGSRKTFLALRPYLLDAHHKYFTAQLNAETIAILNYAAKPKATLALELATGTQAYMALEFLQAAQVNYAVANAVHSGTFELTATGMYQKIDDFIGYKTKTLPDNQLSRIKEDKEQAAQEYFKKALKIIADNPTVFPDYKKRATASFIKPKNTGSIVGF